MAPVRSFVFMVYLIGLMVGMMVIFLPVLALPRRFLVPLFRTWSRLALWGFRVIIGVEVRILGLDRLPPEPFIIASKHQSMWDTIVFSALLKDPALVMKRELMSIPFYGWYSAKMGMIPIDRSAGASALRTMLATARTRADSGRSIVIFPEGTRVKPGAAPDYKPGTAALYRHLDLPCVPVALTSGLCWPNKGFGFRSGKIALEILEPIPPGLDRRTFSKRLEDSIETATANLLTSV